MRQSQGPRARGRTEPGEARPRDLPGTGADHSSKVAESRERLYLRLGDAVALTGIAVLLGSCAGVSACLVWAFARLLHQPPLLG